MKGAVSLCVSLVVVLMLSHWWFQPLRSVLVSIPPQLLMSPASASLSTMTLSPFGATKRQRKGRDKATSQVLGPWSVHPQHRCYSVLSIVLYSASYRQIQIYRIIATPLPPKKVPPATAALQGEMRSKRNLLAGSRTSTTQTTSTSQTESHFSTEE